VAVEAVVQPASVLVPVARPLRQEVVRALASWLVWTSRRTVPLDAAALATADWRLLQAELATASAPRAAASLAVRSWIVVVRSSQPAAVRSTSTPLPTQQSR
jgi:hypothetical protein